MSEKRRGWVKIHRSLMEKAFFKEPDKVTLWLYILLRATHNGNEEKLGKNKIMCQPGQFTTGRKQIAKELNFSESKVERLLTYFEKIEQQIEQRKTSKNRLISIVNWNIYQKDEQHFGQQSDNNRTTSEHTTRMKEDTSLVIKGEKNEKKINGHRNSGESLLVEKYGNKFPKIDWGAKEDIGRKE